MELQIKEKLKFYFIGLLMNLLPVIFGIFIFPFIGDERAFLRGLDYFPYFTLLYFIIILLVSLFIKEFKIKLLFNYLSFSLMILISIIALFKDVERLSIIFIIVFGFGPILISLVSYLINPLIYKRVTHKK